MIIDFLLKMLQILQASNFDIILKPLEAWLAKGQKLFNC